MRQFNRRALRGAALLGLCVVLPAGARAQGDSAVATVNGEPIPAAEFNDRVQHVTVRDFILSTNPLSVRQQTAGQILLDQMINERLTLQWASKTNQLPSDTEVSAEVARAKTQPQLQQALATHQLTEEQLKNSFRYQKARFNLATTAASVSPQDVEKYYKDHLAAFTVPERYTLEGFVTSKQADVPKIQAALKTKPFMDVLKAYCDDPNIKARNGTMGTFNATDPTMPPPIREAAAALKEGAVSGPVKIEAGSAAGQPKATIWWFIRMAHREPGSTKPFSLVKEQAQQAALLERAGGIQVADKKIADFRQVSDIKINLAGYDALLPRPKK
jgi:parvulin-like peptidyl-prolyl isomerase